MHKKWIPTKENVELVIEKIDPENIYTRQQAIEGLGIAGSAFDRYVRLNSMWIAYGNPIVAGRMVLYPGAELVAQFRRLQDPAMALHLFDLYYHSSDREILDELGKSREEVFAKGTYLELGGWKGVNY